MSGFCVQDAPIRRLNASKTISKRKPPPPQTWPSEGLGGSVVRRPGKQDQSSWPLRKNFKGPGGSHAGATAPAGQCRSRPSSSAGFHIRAIRRQSIPASSSSEVEGINKEHV